MPGQVTHFYLAARLAEIYKRSKDSSQNNKIGTILNKIGKGFNQWLKANKEYMEIEKNAIHNKSKEELLTAIKMYRSKLLSNASDDLVLFSAFATGAVGPDLWTVPNRLSDIYKIDGSYYFDLGHYNCTHSFPKQLLKEIKNSIKENKIAELQIKYRIAYILGYLSHIALDILAHLQVNNFAGAYFQQKTAWGNEEDVGKPIRVFKSHNKIEHYLDAFIRYFCFEGYHTNESEYQVIRRDHFKQDEIWNFPSYIYRNDYYNELKVGLLDRELSESLKFLDVSTCLPGPFAYRYLKMDNEQKEDKDKKGKNVIPFILKNFKDAFPKIRINGFHDDSKSFEDLTDEIPKIRYFRIFDISWLNEMDDIADTQYYYLHSIIPSPEKVKEKAKKFFSPEAFGHLINGSLPIAQTFIENAISYLSGDESDTSKVRLTCLDNWNLDTGLAIRITEKTNDFIDANNPFASVPVCIDIKSVLDLKVLKDKDIKLGTFEIFDSFSDVKKEWYPQIVNEKKCEERIELKNKKDVNTKFKLVTNHPDKPLKLSSKNKYKIKVNHAIGIAIRLKNTSFYLGKDENEIAAYIFGDCSNADEVKAIEGIENEYPAYKIETCIEDFDNRTEKYSSKKTINSSGTCSKIYSTIFWGKDYEDITIPEEKGWIVKEYENKRRLPRHIKLSLCRKWTTCPSGSGEFKIDKLSKYRQVFPTEELAFSIFVLVELPDSGDFQDIFHEFESDGKTYFRLFDAGDIDKLIGLHAIGVNTIVIILEKKDKSYKLKEAWIDGEMQSIDHPDDNWFQN